MNQSNSTFANNNNNNNKQSDSENHQNLEFKNSINASVNKSYSNNNATLN